MDIRLIQERYGWFLRDMFHRDLSLRTQNRYAVQIEENGLAALVSGRSLGQSLERDTVPSAVQFKVRESAVDGTLRKQTLTPGRWRRSLCVTKSLQSTNWHGARVWNTR